MAIDIDKLSATERAELLRLLQATKPNAQQHPTLTRLANELVSRDKNGAVDNVLDPDMTPFDHNLLSYDRQCLRSTLEEWARQASETSSSTIPHANLITTAKAQQFAELHKWWDSTSYTIYNDWLFTDEPFVTIHLTNANGESKEFRLRVAP